LENQTFPQLRDKEVKELDKALRGIELPAPKNWELNNNPSRIIRNPDTITSG
jgi:hypothetical protein